MVRDMKWRKHVAFWGLIAVLGLFFLAPAPVVHAEGEGEEETQVDNGIPVINLTIDETEVTIEQMNSSEDHSVSCVGTMDVLVPEGFRYCDMPDMDMTGATGLEMTIRGRGNSTWSQPKKPYKIKLDKKASILGLPKNKHWVLLANAMDETLMKDRMTAWLSERMGFEFTPHCLPVDVVMNGEYLGSYLLAEQVRVGENRLELEEMEETATDPVDITGGYLLQGGQQIDSDSPNHFFTSRGEELANHTPNFDPADDGYENEAQKTYIREYVQQFEDALFDEDFMGIDGRYYHDYIDMKSAADYWLIQTVSCNGDAYSTGSTYVYKKADKDGNIGKLCWGPIWDFDVAWNLNLTEPEEGAAKDWEGFHFNDVWLNAMIYDPVFREEVYQEWKKLKPLLTELTAEGGIIDQYYQEIKESQKANYGKWGSASTKGMEYPKVVEGLKAWINLRTAWYDEHLNELDSLVCKITRKVEGQPDVWTYLQKGYLIPFGEVKKEGYIFLGWEKEDGTLWDDVDDIYVKRDLVLTAKFVSKEEATKATDILFRFKNARELLSMGVYDSHFTVLPADAQDKTIVWSSSDESIAEPDPEGYVTLKQAGTVTITAELPSGVKKSYTLTIVNDAGPALTGVQLLPKQVKLKKGEYVGLETGLLPADAMQIDTSYVSDDPKVARVDENGVVTAVKAGSTTVHVSVTGYDGETVVTDSVTVTVTDGEQKKYSNEWVNGKWYDKNGKQTYDGTASWKKDGKEWKYSDTKGWSAKNRWQKIDGKWYYFDKASHMEKDAYREGYYLTKSGAWDGKGAARGWKKDSTGWWYGLSGKDYLKATWKKIDGRWYYFKKTGYAAQSEFVQGWWCGADCIQKDPKHYGWHKSGQRWWYGVKSGWYAKSATFTIDGVKYRFDEKGYLIEK